MKIKINECRASGKQFENLKPNSIHQVIEAPKGEHSNNGVWVMGIGEPVKVLDGEYTEVKEMRDFICRYWVLHNDDEAKKLKEIIGGWRSLAYDYPYIVGKEGTFTFQEKGDAQLKPYIDVKGNKKYIYKKQAF